MGPGGLRGLQILRSDVQSVRGGFDSHAFPPSSRGPKAWFLSATLIGLWLATTPGTALPQAQTRAAEQRGADSSRTIPRFDQPRWVMLRSPAAPGWGQFHNHAWVKGVGVASAEIGLGLKLLDDKRTLNRLEDQVNHVPSGELQDHLISDYNARLERYVSRQWLFAAVLTYAILDAYIDAHFRNFKIEFENDPALRKGEAPAARVRVSLRWGF